ncbi:prepilin peptidase [Anaerosporomusa subterranea]|uniref:prepilin peptidase n=1 Tax=Anaerosporomusa subterranea TaxID=1794912 RepID=UPI0008248A29|nr:A24 family peptidase [Anaerosporomusa subterranea]
MIILFCILFGLLIGSFLNVCIYRIPLNQSIVYPPSHCPNCQTPLRPIDLIPVLSYFLSGRHCRYCGEVIASRYAIVESLTAFLFVWCFSVFGWTGETVSACVFVSFMVVITFIDYDHQLILDKVLIWFALAGVSIRYYLGSPSLLDMGLAALVGGGLLLIIAVLSRGGMGGGDVKFCFALGIWLGWPDILLALFLSFVIGGLAGVILLVFRLRGRKDMIPFGPFICLGAFLTLLYGRDILTWYFGLMR